MKEWFPRREHGRWCQCHCNEETRQFKFHGEGSEGWRIGVLLAEVGSRQEGLILIECIEINDVDVLVTGNRGCICIYLHTVARVNESEERWQVEIPRVTASTSAVGGKTLTDRRIEIRSNWYINDEQTDSLISLAFVCLSSTSTMHVTADGQTSSIGCSYLSPQWAHTSTHFGQK